MKFWLSPLVLGVAVATSIPSDLPLKLETRAEIKSRAANVHLRFERAVDGPIDFTYGSCSYSTRRDSHHTVAKVEAQHGQRLVWIIPEKAESNGCLSAWDRKGGLVGRSEPQVLHHHWKRRIQKRGPESIKMNGTGFDHVGAWFEGVKLLEQQQPGPVDVEKAKAKEIAIAGLTNVTIIEGGKRLGGRVRTEYLSGGPFDYSYQDLGPMRIPDTYTDPSSNKTFNISDQHIVYQLAEELNKLNGHDATLSVNFIKWIQNDRNGLNYRNSVRMPSGLPPTINEIGLNSSLGPVPVELSDSAQGLQPDLAEYLPGPEFNDLIAKNIFKAHSEWIKNGLKGLGGDVYAIGRTSYESFWASIYNGFYFVYGTWKTVDGGLSRLPAAFRPLVEDVTVMDRRIERVSYERTSDRVKLQWRDDQASQTLQSASYDYAVISAPFTVVRSWRLPPLSPVLSSAINSMKYYGACKVALEFSERFWEHYANPIVGSCSTSTDIPTVGNVCYPSYNVNSTGPASILASYVSGDVGASWLGRSEAEHVQYVLDATVEIHGEEVRALYTGNYNRRCWQLDPLAVGAWGSPTVGQHQLWIPEYHKTHSNLIFVGEHTSITHAWVSSALESGTRGGVQLLLELGLVDEARATVDKWMARWIDV
ncbi:L-amino-acid oxidase like protein, partial [Verticillium longisporum]